MLEERKSDEQCACTHYIQEQTKYTKKKPSLRKAKCAGCGKEFWTNRKGEKVYCFDCEEVGK
ncbi:MAG: hypothetical protein QMC78_03380 [Methanocellales archaeon]|nr:hypothetical protein [Methanocellales archaeon]